MFSCLKNETASAILKSKFYQYHSTLACQLSIKPHFFLKWSFGWFLFFGVFFWMICIFLAFLYRTLKIYLANSQGAPSAKQIKNKIKKTTCPASEKLPEICLLQLRQYMLNFHLDFDLQAGKVLQCLSLCCYPAFSELFIFLLIFLFLHCTLLYIIRAVC